MYYIPIARAHKLKKYKKSEFITDSGVYNSSKETATLIFVIICHILSIGLVVLGIGAYLYK